MQAVIVNTLAIVIASLIGLGLRKGIPEKITDSLMQGLGLCTIIIGVQGCIKEENILVLIVNIALGLLIGEFIDADGHVNRFAQRVTAKFVQRKEEGDAGAAESKTTSNRLAEAFVTSCLIMNVGAMVIVGSLDAGLRADYTMLYTKSLLDFIGGIMMTAAMGIGVMGSAAFTFFFQGGIVLLAQYIAPFMSDAIINELACTGSLIIMALGFNMVGMTRLKIINYIPALAVAPVVIFIMGLLGI